MQPTAGLRSPLNPIKKLSSTDLTNIFNWNLKKEPIIEVGQPFDFLTVPNWSEDNSTKVEAPE